MDSRVTLPSRPQPISPSAKQVEPHSCWVPDRVTLLFLLAALTFLYSLLFVPPFIPIDHNVDGLTHVIDAMRMHEGEAMYRDFFQFVTPGSPLVFFFLFKLFGLRLWIPDLTILLLGLGLAWLGVAIAKKVMRPSLALLPSALFLAGVYKCDLDCTHHWFSLLTAVAAIAALMERRTPARIAAAGFFCGLTLCFTQSNGLAVAAGIGAFLWWESRRRQEGWRKLLKKEAWLVAPFLATLFAVNAYFIWKAGLPRFLWCTVVFGVKYWPKETYVNTFWPDLVQDLPGFGTLRLFLEGSLQWLFVYVVIPFTYVLFFARYRRDSGKKPAEYWARPMLLAIVGSFMLLSIIPAPSLFRMLLSELPGVILLGWLIDSPGKLARAVGGALALGVLLVPPHAALVAQSMPKQILSTPQGRAAFTNRVYYQECVWIQQHTRPLEYFRAAFADVYFYLNLRNPTPLPYITNTGYTTVEQVAEVIRGVELHRPRYIAWSPSDVDDYSWRDPSDDHLGPLRNYLLTHYRLVKVFKEYDEIWERKD